jgi:hypothetical protein
MFQPRAEYRRCPDFWFAHSVNVCLSAEIVVLSKNERPDLIINTHVHFTPVAHWLKTLLKIPFVPIGYGVEVWQIQSGKARRALRSADRFSLSVNSREGGWRLP